MKPWILSLAAAVLIAGCTPAPTPDKTNPAPAKAADTGPKKTIAFITNNTSDFWVVAHKGADKAAAELPGYTIDFKTNSEGDAAGQKRIMDDLVAKGVAGIAISPFHAESQTADLNTIAAKIPLITQDSDAPDSNRACYIGTDNVAAGTMAGQELKKALPNGGTVMVFVGDKGVQNAKERYAGLTKALEGTKIKILDIRTDEAQPARAKQNAADTLVKYPDIAGLVGLWGYNGPQISAAVKEAGKTGKVKIVCFDDDPITLAAVKDGTISATIVQQQFEFGYKSMMLLAQLIEGDKGTIPADKRILIPPDKKIIIPTMVVDSSTIEAFEAKAAELKK